MKNTKQFLATTAVFLAFVCAIVLWAVANIALWDWLTPSPIVGTAGIIFTGYVLPGLALAVLSDLRRRP